LRLRKSLRAADNQGMRQHCTQCLTEVLANGRQAPSGEFLCYGCYLALWGPSASDALREMVHRHSGLPVRNSRLNPQRA
jgi:hypothetical protein